MKKTEIIRIKNLIESDRLNTGENFEELIENDLNKLLSDYFDFKESPVLTIEKQGDLYRVNISFCAVRIKTFGTLPR